MIKRLNTTISHFSGETHWPEPLRDRLARDSTLFTKRTPLRKMVVMIDSELLPNNKSRANITKASLLSGLITHPYIELYKFADIGPPKKIKPEVLPQSTLHDAYEFYRGWIVLGDHVENSHYWHVTYATEGHGPIMSGLDASLSAEARNDQVSDVYSELDAGKAKEKREADAIAAQLASDVLNADLYITKRPYLYVSKLPIFSGTTICTPEEALPIVSLYLRVQQEYFLERATKGALGEIRLDEGLYFLIGTRELLPAMWRWFNACVQHSLSGQGDDRKTLLLGNAVMQRVGRALAARDGVHVAMNQKQNNNVADNALAKLDEVLFLLMGAVDATARVAHIALSLSGSERHAGWQSDNKWLPLVATQEPALAALAAVGTPGKHVLTILGRLRNSIHGKGLQGVALVQNRTRIETLLTLPKEDETDILASMDALGGRALWGVRSVAPNSIHIEPDTLVDKLFEEVTNLLNKFMDNTPVENLSDVNLTPNDSLPPADLNQFGFNEFSKRSRQSIRWQLGF